MKKDEVKVGGTYTAKVSDKVVPIRIDRENPRGGWDATNLVTNKQIRIKTAQRLRGKVNQPAQSAAEDDAAKAVDAVEKGDLTEGVTVPTTKAKKKLTAAERKALVAQAQADQARQGAAADSEVIVFRRSPKGSYTWRRGNHTSPKQYASQGQAERAAKKATGVEKVTIEQTPASEAKAGRSPKRPTEKAAADTAKPVAKGGKRAAKAAKTDKPKRPSLLSAAAEVLAKAKEPMNTKEMVEVVTAAGLWTPGKGKTPEATLYAAIIREIRDKGDDARFIKVERGRFSAAGKAA